MVIEEFQNPPDKYRPLQLILSYEQWFGEDEETLRRSLCRVRELGIGGLVVTVNQQNYLRSEKAWDVLRLALRVSKELGFRLWLYDEEGYPSGAAGGLVLAKDPTLEATGLIRKGDCTGDPAYEIIALYEGTHATENFYQKRRYINILDPKATKTFIEVTHGQYAQHLGDMSQWFEAVFTDEPSLINAYVPKGKTYPLTLPWLRSLPEIFLARKGYDLMPHIEGLYHDTGKEDRKVRCDFYRVISELCAENYFGQIQKWCQANDIASSGHLLGEETLVWQTYFEGDPFACYRKMDIPGIDMILSSPERIINESFFIVPKLASSAARLTGKREVMCEISDFIGESENHPASFEQILCTASILYALGVTDLVCMYGGPIYDALGKRDSYPFPQLGMSAEEYKKYTAYVTRMRSIFSSGKIGTHVAVLHPIVSVWANFTPSDRSMYEPHPNDHVRFINEGFTNLCRALLQNQIGFDIVDDKAVAEAKIDEGELVVAGNRYSVLLLPPMDTIPLQTIEKIARFAEAGGSVIAHALLPRYSAEGFESDGRATTSLRAIFQQPQNTLVISSEELITAIMPRVKPNCELVPANPDILCTKLSVAGQTVYFLVNTSSLPWEGESIWGAQETAALLLFPETGDTVPCDVARNKKTKRRVNLALRPYQSVFVAFTQAER